MLRIATHNSASGERGTFWSWFVCLFSRTQDKTLVEQWQAGCRYFDLRFKWTRKGWKCGHGLWRTQRYAEELLLDLNRAASTDRENKTYAYFTYEGKYKNAEKHNFLGYCEWCRENFHNILITSIDAKYSGTKKNPFIVDYQHIAAFNRCPIGSHPQGFIALDGKHWQTILPIPRLWNWIYTRKHKFDEEKFLFVDFL